MRPFLLTVITLIQIGCLDYYDRAVIDLRGEKLSSIPTSVFINPEMKKELYIGIDEFTVYPPMSILPNGKIPLANIPENIGRLTGLEKLSITSTQIEKLPKSFSNLQELKYLDLSFNEKLNLENELPTLIRLNKLDTLILYGVKLSDDSKAILSSNNRIQIIDEKWLFDKLLMSK